MVNPSYPKNTKTPPDIINAFNNIYVWTIYCMYESLLAADYEWSKHVCLVPQDGGLVHNPNYPNN